MPTYRKKPVEIQAVQWTGSNHDEIRAFLGKDLGSTADEWISDGELYINTREGRMHASVLDYVIRGVQGEHYACKPEIFFATYERVSP